jgi:hypothetical protein
MSGKHAPPYGGALSPLWVNGMPIPQDRVGGSCAIFVFMEVGGTYEMHFEMHDNYSSDGIRVRNQCSG